MHSSSRWRSIGVTALCVVTVTGCSISKAPFRYKPTYIPGDEIPPPWNNAVVSVEDRRSDRSIDDFLTTAVAHAVGQGLASYLRSTGLAQTASHRIDPADWSAAELLSQGYDAQLSATIEDLRWEIENYHQLQATAFFVGLLTGIVGALIMASTETDVDGYAKIHIRLTDLLLGMSFAKTYEGHCEKEWPTFDSDQPDTRSRMVVCAFEMAIEELQNDLEAFADTLHLAPCP